MKNDEILGAKVEPGPFPGWFQVALGPPSHDFGTTRASTQEEAIRIVSRKCRAHRRSRARKHALGALIALAFNLYLKPRAHWRTFYANFVRPRLRGV